MTRRNIFRQVAGKEDMISVFLHRGQLCAAYTHGLREDGCDWFITTDWGNTSDTIGQVMLWLTEVQRLERRFYNRGGLKMKKTYQGEKFKVVLQKATMEEILDKKGEIQKRYVTVKKNYAQCINFLQSSLDPLNNTGADEKYLTWLDCATSDYKSLIELEKINQWLTAWEHELDKKDLTDPKNWM